MTDAPHGYHAPGSLDRAVLTCTSALPNNWLGLRLAIGLRRIVMKRQAARPFDVERWGLRLRLHPSDNGCEKNLLFTPQMYERPECAALCREIVDAGARTGANGRPFVFVDIGANVGLFSLFVAAYAAKARIIAVEPDAENFSRLRFNLDANGITNIEAFRLALDDECCRVAIVPNLKDRGGTSVRRAAPSDIGTIAATTLPLLLKERQVPYVDALKLDAEGAEDRILLPLLKADRSIWPRLVILEDQRGTWKTDLFCLLQSNGYAVIGQARLNWILRRA